MNTLAISDALTHAPSNEAATKLTHTLLLSGVVAGPLYLVVGFIEAFTRPGFDITRHELSLLSNGSFGWLHITDLVVSGLLVIAGAIGTRRTLRSGRGRTWAPVLIGLYGLGLVGAGMFVADPTHGFPPGTPADAHTISTNGLLHIVCGGVGFLALIAACFVFARRFAGLRQRGWQWFSLLTGVVFFAGFVGIASVSENRWILFGFYGAVVLEWVWLSALSAKLRRETSAAYS